MTGILREGSKFSAVALKEIKPGNFFYPEIYQAEIVRFSIFFDLI